MMLKNYASLLICITSLNFPYNSWAFEDKMLCGVTRERLYKFSAVVALQFKLGSKCICGGSLISDRFVLTAAHCVNDQCKNNCGIVESVHNKQKNENLTIEKIIVYPLYDIKGCKTTEAHLNDIALIKLQKGVKFHKYFGKLSLPKKDETILEASTDLTIVGWGLTEKKTHSKRLLKAKQLLVEKSKCNEIYSHYFEVNETQLCADGTEGVTTCVGDSGGPLMRCHNNSFWVIEGIVSFGLSCIKESEEVNFPTIYTRVRSFLPWIEETLRHK